jgi:mannose-6-phosphate isomerase-like protein (cupin superfamily)
MNVVSQAHPLAGYAWGKAAMAWNLVDEENLSIKLEQMPDGEEEALHYHQHAHQFFFILKGKALFEIEGIRTQVMKEQGIHVRPKQKHRIMNKGGEDLQFILCSQPSTSGDRINLESYD